MTTYNPYSAKRIRDRNTAAFNRACQPRPEATITFKDELCVNLRTGEQITPKPVFEYFILHRGMKVILTNHARTQLKRRRDLDIERQKAWFTRAIDGLAEQNWTPKFENHEIFIYNKSMKQGFVIAFRKDFKSDTNKTCMVAVTAYPKGRRKGMHSDTEVVFV